MGKEKKRGTFRLSAHLLSAHFSDYGQAGSTKGLPTIVKLVTRSASNAEVGPARELLIDRG